MLKKLLFVVGCLSISIASTQADSLTVHEIGTFIVLQDVDGRALGALNVDDEPAPPFVKLVGDGKVRRLNERPVRWLQKNVDCDPSVTARIEGPIIFFHSDSKTPPEAALNLTLKGGWLTQFFPNAAVEIDDFSKVLSQKSLGKLSWPAIKLSSDAPTEATNDLAWLAARSANATTVTNGNESEKFLFASGIGMIDAPLIVKERSGGGILGVKSQIGASLVGEHLWLVGVQADGAVAFNSAIGDKNSEKEIALRGNFLVSDFRFNNQVKLRREIQTELMNRGLFESEAVALLDAWDASYFKSPGKRLLYIPPRAWLDRVMPLEVKPAAKVSRVYIGQIELITAAQREVGALLARDGLDLSRMTAAYYDLFRKAPSEASIFANSPLKTLPQGFQAAVPNMYWSYLGMGRFRDTLLLDDLTRAPSTKLKSFLKEVGCKNLGVDSVATQETNALSD